MNVAKDGKNITLTLVFDYFEDEKQISTSMLKSEETNDFKMLINHKTVNKKVMPNYNFE